MADVLMPTMLRPATQGALLSERPSVGQSRLNLKLNPLSKSVDSKPAKEPMIISAKPDLSVIEIESVLRARVQKTYDSLQMAFQNYDVDKNLSVTKGEFRRVLETYCLPMTTEQFEAILAKVQKNKNGTVKYCDFLDKFYGVTVTSKGGEKWMSGTHKLLPAQSPKEHMNVDQIEKMIRETIGSNLRNVIKAFYLFDYNRDGKIQRHEFRKVLENYVFKFTDQQFDKLWQRYDFHHTGLLSYRDFLYRLGVNVTATKEAESHPEVTHKQRRYIRPPVGLTIPDESLKDMNFDQMEVEFRKRMVKNYKHLVKMFVSMDPEATGFISLESLKSILNSFTMPMSDQLFRQLMERCGVRATGKIAWEIFLEKFQDPQARGNGQTIPIKKNHKFFPVRETEEVASAEVLLNLLHDHVENDYPSFRQAFLGIDKNRTGKISRKKLKEIVEKFNLNLSNEEYKILFQALDPDNTGRIKYHTFLELFEPRETHEGHKWLQSVHTYNDKPKPAILAWETVEDILRDKIKENWRYIGESLVYYDSQATGRVKTKKLRRILEKWCLPLSREHFNSMVARCDDQVQDEVNYTEFFEKMNVDISPGDTVGLSTQITHQSEANEMRRLSGHYDRSGQIVQHVVEKTDGMSPEEIIVRLKDRMSQHNVDMRKSFLSYAKSGKGTITKREFREVLESFGMVLSDEQFAEVVLQLNFHKSKMSYFDFVTSFEDPQGSGTLPGTEGNPHPPNHRVNAIRGGDEISMTAEEAEYKLKQKLRENFADLRGAFYKFDENHTGVLKKEAFRRLLDSFMVTLSDFEFDRLCDQLRVTKRSRISYKDFLNRFEVVDTPDGHKWLNSDHTWNETYDSVTKSAEEVHDILVKKVHQQWRDLAKAFMVFDSDGNGIIRKKELRAILKRFCLPIDREQFDKLWARYDIYGKKYINHQEFLQRLGAEEFTPGDVKGMSKRIIDDSYASLNKHHNEQLQKQEAITVKQAVMSNALDVDQVERQLRDRIRDYYPSMYAAFRKYDTDKKGFISVKVFQKVLIDLNYFLDDDQFFTLLDRIGLKTNNSKLSYEQFLEAFEDGRKSSYGDKEGPFRVEKYDHLNAKDAEHKLRIKVTENTPVLQAAFKAFDSNDSGGLPIAEFRRLLDNFCFKMSDAQFKHILNRMSAQGDSSVNYNKFIDMYRGPQQQNNAPFWRKDLQGGPMFAIPQFDDQEDSDKWLDTLNTVAPPQSPRSLDMGEVMQNLREIVTARFYTVARALAETDYAKIGVVAKDDFRRIIDVHTFRLSDEQFESLWSSLKVNEFNNVDYRDFLKRYSSAPSFSLLNRQSTPSLTGRNSATLQRRPASQMAGRPSSRADSRLGELFSPRQLASRAQGAGTPLVNAEMVERKIRDRIYKHWQFIQKQARVFDPTNHEEMDASSLREILAKCGVKLHEYEFNQLRTKYDIDNNGRFHYMKFLRNFVLPPNQPEAENSVLLARKRLHKSKIQTSTGAETMHFFDAMLRLRPCVVTYWKEMRRTFRGIDKQGIGIVSLGDFRQVLKQFGANLEEDEFYHLMTYYDKDLKGEINYNSFISEFLKSC